ncbi:MAG: hypothetical protein ACI9WU_003653, partial [Myxococcota bacterium]
YFGGRQLMVRWAVLQRAVAKIHKRWGSRLDDTFSGLLALGSLIGLPPAVGMVLLAPGFGLPLRTVLMITIPLRFIRFTIVAYAGLGLWDLITG